MKKRFCVLQITPFEPNAEHKLTFSNKKQSDFFFVTYDKPNKESLKFCPNTVWSETRNILCELVPKEYDYYVFMDYDAGLAPQTNLNMYEQILEDLKLNPAVLTYYPGQNLHSPFVNDKEFFNSRKYSCIPFTHNGVKIVHKSLLKWFFPMFTRFRVDIDACHMFNIQEIPFLSDIVCSHNMIYNNTYSSPEQSYNKNSVYTKNKMDEMWNYIRPAYKKENILRSFASSESQIQDSLFIKEVFLKIFRDRDILPKENDQNIDYYNLEKISKFFNLEHEYFKNK